MFAHLATYAYLANTCPDEDPENPAVLELPLAVRRIKNPVLAATIFDLRPGIGFFYAPALFMCTYVCVNTRLLPCVASPSLNMPTEMNP